jgi:hypothetical protein
MEGRGTTGNNSWCCDDRMITTRARGTSRGWETTARGRGRQWCSRGTLSGALCSDVFFVYRLVIPFCTEVLHWPVNTCIFVCKHLDGTVDLFIYT